MINKDKVAEFEARYENLDEGALLDIYTTRYASLIDEARVAFDKVITERGIDLVKMLEDDAKEALAQSKIERAKTEKREKKILIIGLPLLFLASILISVVLSGLPAGPFPTWWKTIDLLSVAVNFVITWSIGLAPPFLIRYIILKKPIGELKAFLVCVAFCYFNIVFFTVIGSLNKSHAVLAVIAFVSYRILRRTGITEDQTH